MLCALLFAFLALVASVAAVPITSPHTDIIKRDVSFILWDLNATWTRFESRIDHTNMPLWPVLEFAKDDQGRNETRWINFAVGDRRPEINSKTFCSGNWAPGNQPNGYVDCDDGSWRWRFIDDDYSISDADMGTQNDFYGKAFGIEVSHTEIVPGTTEELDIVAAAWFNTDNKPDTSRCQNSFLGWLYCFPLRNPDGSKGVATLPVFLVVSINTSEADMKKDADGNPIV